METKNLASRKAPSTSNWALRGCFLYCRIDSQDRSATAWKSRLLQSCGAWLGCALGTAAPETRGSPGSEDPKKGLPFGPCAPRLKNGPGFGLDAGGSSWRRTLASLSTSPFSASAASFHNTRADAIPSWHPPTHRESLTDRDSCIAF
eukprot:scaffold2990_cov239-Pinguiococcus_pyrenoidosus.AAC.5